MGCGYEIMKYVVRIEAEAKGFRLIDLFGKTYSSREPSKSLNS
jgi:predicted RNA-binding protein